MSAAPDEGPVVWDEDGRPRSRRFGDIYHSRDGGLGQAHAVFLDGCGLPDGWRGRRRFTVAELGFGTGLNVAALLALWAEARPAGARLAIFSVEADPLAAADARRALSAFPEIDHVAEQLLSAWPGRAAGFHRLDLPDLAATLDVAVMEAAAALEAWRGRADAWFLDGFSPAVNPAMWSPELMRLVARRSAPGARLATWSVAGAVRRALAEAGIASERRSGFGAKRERLVAAAPGAREPERPEPRVAIVGAGIGGAALARAFGSLGASPRLVERTGPGAGASGNRAALVTPRLDAGLGTAPRLHAEAFRRASRLYGAIDGAVIARGLLHLETSPRDAARFERIAASSLFERGALRRVPAGEVSERLGEPAPPALDLTDAPTIDPGQVLADWSEGLQIAEAARLTRAGEAWRLEDAGGRLLAEAEVLCLATGADLKALWPEAPMAQARGQLSFASGLSSPAASWGAYVAPATGGIVFGATWDRGEADADARPGDDLRNLEALAQRLPGLAARVAVQLCSARAAVRATTADRLPLAGEIAPGLFVLGALGARGFTLAPLLADHLAASALGAPSPLAADLAPIVDPARFQLRAARRAGSAPRGRSP